MRRFVIGMLALLVALMLAPQHLMAQTGTASVRVLHMSPDAPSVDVYVDGQRALEKVTFGAASDYLPIPTGEHRIQIVPTGQEDLDDAVIDTTIDLRRARPYTLAAINSLDNIELLVRSDITSAVPEGQARVRIFHVAPDAGAVDIRAAGSTTPVLTNQYFKSADYVNLPAGTYAFEALRAGTNEVALTTPELRFEPGWSYTVFVTGSTDEAQPLIAHPSVERTAE
jgi:hypothetical protein